MTAVAGSTWTSIENQAAGVHVSGSVTPPAGTKTILFAIHKRGNSGDGSVTSISIAGVAATALGSSNVSLGSVAYKFGVYYVRLPEVADGSTAVTFTVTLVTNGSNNCLFVPVFLYGEPTLTALADDTASALVVDDPANKRTVAFWAGTGTTGALQPSGVKTALQIINSGYGGGFFLSATEQVAANEPVSLTPSNTANCIVRAIQVEYPQDQFFPPQRLAA